MHNKAPAITKAHNPGGQLTTTTDVENFPGFPKGINGYDLCNNFREQSVHCGAKIFTETVTRIDTSTRPFKVYTDKIECAADTVIICTGAVARRLEFPGAGEGNGYWNKGISACAVCDGASPMFRGKPIAVIGGGDSAMEEANFLTKYGSKVYIIHRRDSLRASKVMQRRSEANPKIEFFWNSVVSEATGDAAGFLSAIKVKNLKSEEVSEVKVAGLFFAIGHEPATAFLDNQVELDEERYIMTTPGSTATSVPGVFAAGDVQDKKWRQAITAAGTGARPCMRLRLAALAACDMLGALAWRCWVCPELCRLGVTVVAQLGPPTWACLVRLHS
jgi:thioredoxin reductase (NADPH)